MSRTETKHTPGPWRYTRTHRESLDYWYVITDAEGWGLGFDVGGRDLPGQIAEGKHLAASPEVIEANARLIAEAPAMLEALKPFAQLDAEISHEDCARARALLDRIEGSQK